MLVKNKEQNDTSVNFYLFCMGILLCDTSVIQTSYYYLL